MAWQNPAGTTRIYQLDSNKVFNEFGEPISRDLLEAYRDARDGVINRDNAKLYHAVWGGKLTQHERAHIFREFNRVDDSGFTLERLDAVAQSKGFDCYRMNSLSVGDVIVDYDAKGTIERVEIVARFGFNDVLTAWCENICCGINHDLPEAPDCYFKSSALSQPR